MNNSKILWGILVAALVVVVIVAASGRGGTPAPSESASPTLSEPASPSPSPRPTALKTLTYQEALQKYGGTRIQFDARCQAIPYQITVKNGAVVMLDNRSGDPRTVSVGTTRYAMAGYGFRIITVSSKTLPATLLIDCGAAQNVGQILVQR